MLKLVDIKKDYVSGDSVVHALKGISVNFRRSEFVSVLGPSGCGKTTLLNIIGGLDDYSDGDLVIGDRSTKDFGSRDWDSYRNHTVGFVFQSYNLIPHLTILQNVELALTISGMPRKKKRELAENALIRVGLGGMFKKKPGQLSGGQMQRVAIARAIVGDPKTILADEPTGALDSVTSVQIMDLLAEISGDKLVIMVTHNPELARRYSTRIIELRDGEIVGDSDPYDGLPTMLSPVGAVDPRSPIEEYIDENAAEERAKDQEAQAEGEGQPEASEGEGEEPSEERSEGAKKKGKQKNKQDKFVALVSPEKPEKLKKRSGQPKEKRQRASMSLFTAIGLSARNLITKKTRTILTAIAGSIGIIGIALVLSMSNGFNLYMDRMEQEILTAMPVQIASTGVQIDVDEAMQMPTVEGEFPDTDTIRPYQPEAGWQGVEISANIITEEYVDYVRGLDKELVSSVKYRYTAGMRLVREGKSAAEGSAANVATGTVKWQQLLWPEFMNSMYDVLAGGYPGSEEADELLAEYTGTSSWADGENYDGATARQAVLVIGSTNSLDVGILHELGIYPRYLQDSKYDEISFDEVLGTTFELVAPDNRYERAPAEEGERELFEEIGSPEKLLGKEGEHEVGLGLGNKAVERLGRIAKALAEETAGANGDHGLGEVVPVVCGVNVGVDEDDETVELILLEDMRYSLDHRRYDHERRDTDDEGDREEDPGARGAAHDDDGGADEEDDETRPEVEGHDEEKRDEQRAAELRVVPERLYLAVILRRGRGHQEDDDDLGGLGGLESHGPEPDPAHHAVHLVTEARDARENHEHASQDEERRGHARERPRVVAPHGDGRRESDGYAGEVAREVCLGNGEGGGEYRHHADDDEQQGRDELREIQVPQRASSTGGA